MPRRIVIALILIAACSAAAIAHADPSNTVQVRPGVSLLPGDDSPEAAFDLRRSTTRSEAFGAIATPVDSFLVLLHGFDSVAGGCSTRGWRFEDRVRMVWTHVDNKGLVNDGFVNMGSKALWFGADLASDAAAGGHEVENWLIPSGYGNNWSQRLTSPSFARQAGHDEVLTYDARVALRRDFTANPITSIGLNAAWTGAEFLGAQALLTDGTWAHLVGRAAVNGGPATWPTTPPLFSSFWTATSVTPAATLNAPNQSATDANDNLYVADFTRNIVAKYDRWGTFILMWGSPGSNASQFNGPSGIAIDRATGAVYVADSGNNRIQKFDTNGVYEREWGGFGAGAGQFNTPEQLAVDASGTLFACDLINHRVQKFTSTGAYVGEIGTAVLASARSVAVGVDGSVYVADPFANLVYKLHADGSVVYSWCSLGNGDLQTNIPSGLALDRDGYLYVTDQNNNRVMKYDVSGPAPVFLAKFGNPGTSSFSFVTPSGITITRHGDIYVSETGRSRVDHWTNGGPIAGYGTCRYEARLGEDGNELLPLADPIRVRIVMQTSNVNSDEDGNLLAGDDGLVVVDNLKLRASPGGGAILAVPDVDFENGTTGVWALSAQNGYYGASNIIQSIIRDTPDAAPAAIRSGADANDPTCALTFTGPSGYIEPGTYTVAYSPWIPKAQSDWANVIEAIDGKFNPQGSAVFVAFRLRGKSAGSTHASTVNRPPFVFGGVGPSDLAMTWEPGNVFDTANSFFGTFGGSTAGLDSVRIEMEVTDQCERRLAIPATQPGRQRTRLPVLDNVALYLFGVDTDYDGVRNTEDAQPTVCAAGRDANGDGAPDLYANLKHIETWANTDRPIHWTISTAGLPGITDGSDVAALRAGFTAWKNVTGTTLATDLVEDPQTAQTNAISGDGVHLLTFGDDYEFPANVLAVTPTLSYTRRQTFDDRVVLPGQIVDADIMFNPKARFYTATQGTHAGGFDLQSVATHEIGHFLGLSHTGARDATMYPVIQDAEGAASLEDDDVAAIRAAYPDGSIGATHGTISGHVLRGGNNAPLPGAFVYASKLVLGVPTGVAASDYTDEAGAYVLAPLPTNESYAVRVLPLDGSLPGLLPGAINAQVQATAETNFQAEYYGGSPESNHDDPAAITPVALIGSGALATAEIVTNIDVTPPTVDSVSPAPGQTGVRIDTPVQLTFSEPIESSTLSTAFRLHKQGVGTRLGGSGQLLGNGLTFVFLPSAPLEFDTEYDVQITTALTDREGNALAVEHVTSFHTQTPPPVTIAGIEPREAPVGALLTLTGSGYDFAPGGQNKVYFQTGGSDFVLGTFVTATSMVVQVPPNAQSGLIHVVNANGQSNDLNFNVLSSEVAAPSPNGAAIPLSFQPSDVALAPAADAAYAVGDGKFARINLDPARPSLRTPLDTAVPNAVHVALLPSGQRAWVTRPDNGSSDHAGSKLSEVDTDPNSATYGQVLGDVLLPGYLPTGIAIASTGQRAYVSDQASDRVLEFNVDPTVPAGEHTLLREIRVPNALFSGGLALDPPGRYLYAGTDNLGLLSIDLGVDPPVATTLDPAAIGDGVALTPTGARVLAVEGGANGRHVVFHDASPGTGSGSVAVGGEPRAILVSPRGSTAFVTNAQFAQLQVLDVTQPTPVQVADVSTGAGPVAVALSSSGSQIAVANAAGHSVSMYNVSSAAITPVRTTPAVGIPGDVVAMQTTGGSPDLLSAVDLGAGNQPFARVTTGGGAFTVPALDPRDGSVTLSVGGARSLSLPFRIVRPIASTIPQATGVVLDPVNAPCGAQSVDGRLPALRVSPDGRMLALLRDAPGCFVRLDLYRVSTSQGSESFGERLLDGLSWGATGPALDLAFTPDGNELWVATADGGLVAVGANPTAPGFGSAVPFGAAQTGVVRALATDPLGRWIVVGADPTGSGGEVQLWSPGRTLQHAAPVGGRIHSLAATPDGRLAIAGGEGQAYFVDLDAGTLVATSPAHAVSPPDAISSIAVTTDGLRAVGSFPNGRAAIWVTDPAVPAGTERWFGVPSPGAAADHLVPAPSGHSVLAAGADGNLVEITPATPPGSTAPPTVTTRAFGQPVRALARTPDGRQLWAANWSDATLSGDVRLTSAADASRLAVLSGRDQVATQGTLLPLPIRVQVTNAHGDPEAGAPLRFLLADASHGAITPGPLTAIELTDIHGEAQVAWTMPAAAADVSLEVRLLGSAASPEIVNATSAGPAASTPPEVVEIGPADGSTGINANTQLFVRFSQPIDPNAITATPFTLTLTDPTPGSQPQFALTSFTFSGDGKTAFVTPQSPLTPSASARLDVNAGVFGTNGLPSTRAAFTTFRVQDPPILKLGAVSPPSGQAGIPVTISGAGFDPVAARNDLRFGGIVAPVTSASPTSITANVPNDLPLGDGPITLSVGATTAGGLSFLALAPNPPVLALEGSSNAAVGVSAIAITPDGQRGYITVSASNSVLAFSLVTKQVLASIPVGLAPSAITIPADGKRAYVANSGSNDVSVIDIDPASPAYNQVIKLPGHPIKVGAQPTSIVVAAYGPQVLVLNAGDGTVSIIDAEQGNATYDRVTSTSTSGSGGKQIVVTPDGTRAYIANSEGIVMLDLSSKAVTTVATSGSGGKQVAISPDGALLFALVGNGDLLVVDISPGSVSFNRVIVTAPTGSGGKAVAISPDGTLLYVTLHDDSAVAVFSIVTGSGASAGGGVAPGPAASLVPRGTVPVGSGPEGIAVSPDGSFALVANGASGTISLLSVPTPSGSVVAAQAPPATCLTPGLPCLAVPVTVVRDSVASMLGYSVKVQLSPNLSLCGAQVVQGDYLSSLGTTFFHVTDLGAGAYVVDCAILGSGCGATAAAGTLFTLDVASSDPSGTGTIAVTDVALRDCANQPIPSLTGPVASIPIDNTIPAPIVALAAAQVRTANGSDGTTRITVSWPAVTPGDEVLVYRAPFGNYPEYDDAPNAGAAPSPPSYPPGAAWAPVGTFASATTSVTEEPPTRDFWYYAAFVRDGCGNVSPVSNRTNGTLNYHLGDVANGVTNCAGNNVVDAADLSFLGAHYGATLGASDPLACLDVGPTTDRSVLARPTTDNRLDFEDLVVFAINYDRGPSPPSAGKTIASGVDAVALDAPASVRAGETVLVTVHASGSGAVHALSVRLGWNAAVLVPDGFESGGFLEAQKGIVMSPGPGGVDGAVLGAQAPGIAGEGALAVFRFRVLADGNSGLTIASAEGRDADNATVAVDRSGALASLLPTRTLLEAPRPNPFVGSTELRFAIAQGGPVELEVFSVSGRKVRTLVHEGRAPGVYQVVWDGKDDDGAATASGVFFVRFSAPGVRTVRTLARMR